MKLKRQQPERLMPARTVEAAAVSQEGSERYFDPRVDITEADVDALIVHINDPELVMSLVERVEFASDIVLLRPERRAEINDVEGYFESGLFSVSQSSHSFLDKAEYYYKLLRLCRVNKQQLNLERPDMEEVRQSLDAIPGIVGNRLMSLRDIAVLYPEHREDLGLDDEAFDEYKKHADSWRGKDWNLYLHTAGCVRILFPDRLSEIGFDQEANDGVMELLNRRREEKDWQRFINLAATLSVLTADEIQITERGVEIINNTPLEQKAELPDRNLAQ